MAEKKVEVKKSPEKPKQENPLPRLFLAKGELTTTIEIAQARLQQVNAQISEVINKQQE
jgi:hypothetical protein